MKVLRLELKVCEGCGVLWIRSEIKNGVYCTICLKRLEDFPEPAGKRAGGRPRTSLRRAKGCCAGGAK